jgi:hypothetical protein
MKKAILHIGTEKTGSTSIQQFLFQNRTRLSKMGYLFPETAGYLSNRKLVVYGKRAPEADLAEVPLDVNDPRELAQWKESFVLKHCEEILQFHSRHKNNSTVVYSSEHLQSRLTTTDEIKSVARLLRPLYDEMRVVVYLRRQDRYAMSAHSTAIRGGNSNSFSFENVNGQGPYYNYRELLQNWSGVFGEAAIDVRIFEKGRLQDGDVVCDFRNAMAVDPAAEGLKMPPAENEALSYTAQVILRKFNALPATDWRLTGNDATQARSFLLEKLQSVNDEFGKQLPSRKSADTFYAQFRQDNQWIADRWLKGCSFDESFADYPECKPEVPEVTDAGERLDELLGRYLKLKKPHNRLSSIVQSAFQR